MDKPRYIAIEGPIGVGKTSLVKLFCEEFNARGVFEDIEANPFIEKFYSDRGKYAFQTQLFFLLNRYQQQKELNQQELFKETLISDYIFAKDRIFAYMNLDEDELNLYEQIYQLLEARITKPDLVIFLQAEPWVLMERIRRRGKEYENNLGSEYVSELVQAYNRFFFHYDETPLLVVNTSELDFVSRKGHLEGLIKEIRGMSKGVRYFVPRLGT